MKEMGSLGCRAYVGRNRVGSREFQQREANTLIMPIFPLISRITSSYLYPLVDMMQIYFSGADLEKKLQSFLRNGLWRTFNAGRPRQDAAKLDLNNRAIPPRGI